MDEHRTRWIHVYILQLLGLLRPLEFPGHIYIYIFARPNKFHLFVSIVYRFICAWFVFWFWKRMRYFYLFLSISIYFYIFLRFWVTDFYRHDELFIFLLSKLYLSLCFGWIYMNWLHWDAWILIGARCFSVEMKDSTGYIYIYICIWYICWWIW